MPSKDTNPYNLSFTAASLRPELARIVAEAYLTAGDWNVAKVRILATNALQCRSTNTAIRLEREFRHRLEALTTDQITLLACATADDRAALAWLAALKRIQFAFDFASEVLRDKLAAQDPVLRPSDYEAFFDLKAMTHPELIGLTDSSRRKVRQVLFNMLVEAGLLTDGTASARIQRPVLSPEVLRVITVDNPQWLAGFLCPEGEIVRR